MMFLAKALLILIAVLLGFFVLTFLVYFFNLDMKLVSKLIKPLTKWYDWSKARRDKKKKAM